MESVFSTRSEMGANEMLLSFPFIRNRVFRTLLAKPWQEEVEIEAKVVGEKEKATAAVVEIRRRSNGELIASGRQWMATGSNNRRELSKL